jgi:hypothetical protein
VLAEFWQISVTCLATPFAVPEPLLTVDEGPMVAAYRGRRDRAQEKRTSAAEAVRPPAVYGTAEAVPFVGRFISWALGVTESGLRWPK